MVDELKRAIKRAEKLPASEQKVIAQLVSDELNWEKTLEETQNELSLLANEALDQYKLGNTKPFEF